MATLAFRDAGYRHRAHRAQGDARVAAGSHGPDGVCRRRATLLYHPSVLLPRRVQESCRIHQPQRQREGRRMESGIRILLLSVVLALSGCASVRNWLDRDEPPPTEETQEDAEQADSADADA